MLCAVLVSAGIAFSLPRTAGAFWPFAITNAAESPAPMLHDASLDLLDAPLNTDPNAVADNSLVATADGSALVEGEAFGTSTPLSDTSDSDSTDTVTSPTSGTISTYTVKAGDSLSEIAQNSGVSVNTILWANNITNPGSITTGTKLVILPVSGIQHTVRSGETLASLAQKYGADADDIAQFNGISAGGVLAAGSTIIIPGGEITSPETSSKTSTPKESKTTTSTKSSSKSSSSVSISSKSSASAGTGAINYSDETGNPYKGGSGAALRNFFTNPLPGAILTQGIHGWNAVDLGAHTGTPIVAAAGGTVILSRTGGYNGGYGNYVIVDNGNGISTLYAHMSQTKADVGETVSAGEVIGYVGMTGDATGPHLHFEVRGAENPFAHCEEMSVCSPE